MDFKTLHRNFLTLIESLEDTVLDSAMEQKNAMADLNVKQMEGGIGYDGKLIKPSYASFEYGKAKKAMGSIAPLMTPDLKLTGSTHEKTEAVRKSKAIAMMSTDEKYPELNDKYVTAWGLTKVSIEDLKPDNLESLLKKSRLILHRE
jgi:hypothetical protein